MTSKYHTRKGYEQLYKYLLYARDALSKYDVSKVSDFHLLCAINRELREQNCILMNSEELEMELH
jgi:hypothetical protein